MVRVSGSSRSFKAKRLGLALVIALGVSACDRFSSADELLASAREALSRNDRTAAVIQLKNALQKNPDFAEARFELGRIYVETGDMLSAVKELQKSIELGMAEERVVPLLAKAMIESGDAQGLQSRYGTTQLKDPAAQASLQASLGYAAMQARAPEAAAAHFEAALAVQPDDLYAKLGKARLIGSQGDIDGAAALLKQIMASGGDADHEAWFLDADIKAAQGKFDDAILSYRKVFEIKPDHLRSRYTVIVGLANEGKLDEARKEIAAFRKLAPRAPEGNYLDALLFVKEKKFGEARERLNKLLSTSPDYVPGLALAALTEYELQSFAQAEQHAEKAIAGGGDLMSTRKVLIASYMRTGRSAKALQVLAPLLKAHPDDPLVLSMAGQIYLADGDAAAASKAFAQAAAKAPDDPAMRSRLGLSRLAQGDTQGGLDELQAAARLDTEEARSDIVLIVTHLRNRNVPAALLAIDQMEKKRPDDPMAQNLRGTALLLKNDVAGARSSFEKALKLQEDFFPAAANLAKIDMLDKRIDDAEGRYLKILARHPGHADALMALAGLKALGRNDLPGAVKLFEKAIDANPRLASPRVLLAQLYLAAGDPGKSVKVISDAAVAFPDDMSVLDTLAIAQSAAGDHDAAVGTRSRMVARNPQAVPQVMLLANTQFAAGRDTEAIQTVRKALSLQPDLLDAYSLLVRIHMKQKNLDQALQVARDMQKRHPKQAEGYLKEGEILLAANKPADATKPLREAFALESKSDTVIMLYLALDRSGSSAEAATLASEWLKSTPRDPKVRMFLGDTALGQGRDDEARRQYEQVIKVLPDNAVVLNNLAWLARKRGDPKAMEYAERAYGLSPKAPAILDTYGEILVGAGQADRGLALLREAVASAPQSPEYRFTLARALIKAGKVADARKELEALAALGDRYPRSGDAAALLKTL
jgi:cellulose synthase operon protein C